MVLVKVEGCVPLEAACIKFCAWGHADMQCTAMRTHSGTHKCTLRDGSLSRPYWQYSCAAPQGPHPLTA